MLFNVCVGTRTSEGISQLGLFFLLAVAQLACCSRVRLQHAEHLNVENGSFGSFNGVSVFVCERELSDDGREEGNGKRGAIMLSHIVPSRSDPVLTHILFAVTIYSFDTALVLSQRCSPQ